MKISMCIRQTNKGIQLSIKVKPNTKTDQIIEIEEQRLVIAIAAPPIEGRVNQKLIKILSKITKTPAQQINLIKGKQSRYKELLLPNSSQWDWLSKIPIKS